MKKLFILLPLVIAALALPKLVHSHCQVPCGIYSDHARILQMLEDASTTAKAITQINELADKPGALNANQLTRWVMNKESHAENIIQTISNYYLTQRVKPSQADYADRLQKHHAVMLAAMKVKQSVSSEDAEALVAAIKAIEGYYPK